MEGEEREGEEGNGEGREEGRGGRIVMGWYKSIRNELVGVVGGMSVHSRLTM